MINVKSDCKSAMDIMSKYDFEGLPVYSGNNPNKVVGMIWRKDIQDAYQKAIEAREITSSLASSIVMKDDLPQVHFMEGYSISEISAPKSFMNKSIRELDIRARYGVEVLSIKTIKNKSEIIKAIPNADYIIRKDDVLVVAGEIRNINILQNVD
jgi:Trk K+ transport system NAD-binding subunit